MSRPPEDIQQDVWDAASIKALEYVEWLIPAPHDYAGSEYVLSQVIARAILAAKAEEREACVQACETLVEVIRDEIAGEGRPSHRGNLSGQINAVRTAIEYILKRGDA